MNVIESIVRAEGEWRESRDSLGVTFLSIATPLSLAVEISEACLPFLKASIYLAALGILLSMLRKRWRPSLHQEDPGTLPGLLLRTKRFLFDVLHKYSSAASSWLLLAALVSLLIAVYRR